MNKITTGKCPKPACDGTMRRIGQTPPDTRPAGGRPVYEQGYEKCDKCGYRKPV